MASTTQSLLRRLVSGRVLRWAGRLTLAAAIIAVGLGPLSAHSSADGSSCNAENGSTYSFDADDSNSIFGSDGLQAAFSYACDYQSSNNTTGYFPSAEDSADFASQLLVAAGELQTPGPVDSDGFWWTDSPSGSGSSPEEHSRSWTNPDDLYDYLIDTGAGQALQGRGDTYPDTQAGDLIFWNFYPVGSGRSQDPSAPDFSDVSMIVSGDGNDPSDEVVASHIPDDGNGETVDTNVPALPSLDSMENLVVANGSGNTDIGTYLNALSNFDATKFYSTTNLCPQHDPVGTGASAGGCWSWQIVRPMALTPPEGPIGPNEVAGGQNPSETATEDAAGDPVDNDTGEYDETDTDLAISGRGPGISFVRSYGSLSSNILGPLGYGWTDSYNMSIAPGDPTLASESYEQVTQPDGTVVDRPIETITQENGSQVTFAQTTVNATTASATAPWVPFSLLPTGQWGEDDRVQATLSYNSDSGVWTFTSGGQETFTFNNSGANNTGELTSESDLNGDTTQLSYNNGELSTITDAAGRTLTLSYTGSLISKLTDSTGRTVSYNYNSADELTSVENVRGETTSYTYGSTGTAENLLTSITTPDGGVTANTYDGDGSGRVVSQTQCTETVSQDNGDCPSADQQTTSWNYDTNPSTLTGSVIVTDSEGIKTLENYSDGDLTLQTVNYGGPGQAATTTYSYGVTDGAPDTNQPTAVTDPDGNTTTYTYDAAGNKLSQTDALGNTTVWTYNQYDEVTSETLPATYGGQKATTTYAYDQPQYSSGNGAGNLTSINSPIMAASGASEGSQTTVYEYQDADHPGDVTAMISPDGDTWTYTYDQNGDKTSQTAPATGDNSDSNGAYQDVTRWVYNNLGEQTEEMSGRYTLANPGATSCTTPAAGCTTTSYDAAGNVLATTDGNGHTTTSTYDPDGNVLTSTDPKGNETTFGYNAVDEKISTTQPDNSVLKTTYTPDGQVASQIDAAGDKTIYTYDRLGNRISSTDPDGHETTYGYDADGIMVWKADPGVSGCDVQSTEDGCTVYSYDADDREVGINYNDANTHNVSYSYDPDGRRVGMSDASGNSSWSYDSLGRMSSTTNGAGATIGYGYDAGSNITSITYPGQTGTVFRSFDAAGRISQITDWQGNVTKFDYDADGDLATTVDPTPSGLQATSSVIGAGGEGGGELGTPTYSAVDSNGDIWVSDSYHNQIDEFSAGGNFITSVGSNGSGSGQVSYPLGIAVNSGAGDVYVADYNNNRIDEFTTGGTFVRSFGSQGSGNGELQGPTGIALDSAGNVWVADTYNHRIEEFSPTGAFMNAYGSYGTGNGQFEAPRSLAISGPNIFVLDSGNDRVEELTTSGTYVSQFASHGSDTGQLDSPMGIAVDPATSDIYVADSGNNRIEIFSPTGSPDGTLGSSGSGNGDLSDPFSLSFNSAGIAYIDDTGNNRLSVWTPLGTTSDNTSYDNADQISSITLTQNDSSLPGAGLQSTNSMIGGAGSGGGNLGRPSYSTTDSSGNLWVSDTYYNQIDEFSPTGAFITSIGSQGTGTGQMSYPLGIAVNSSAGDVYVADYNNNRIDEFTTSGTFVRSFGSQGSGNGQLQGPSGITLDSNDDVWVADTYNNRVEEFSPTGTYINSFGGYGTGNGQFEAPRAVAINGNDLFVLDTGNDRVQEEDTQGNYITQFGSSGSGSGQLSSPMGMALDPLNGNLYIADTGNNRLVAFSQTGTTLGAYGSSGSGTGDLSGPDDLSFTSSGNADVDDTGNSHITSWTPATATPITNTLASFAYSRDADGNVTQVTSAGVPSDNHTYTYNSLDQLSGTDGNSYSYNFANELTAQPGAVSQTYDSAGELTSISNSSGSVEPTYDDKGEQLTGGLPGQANQRYTWNQAGELATATVGDGPSYSYTYNGDGLRTAKTVNGVSEQYLWDSNEGDVPVLLQDGATSYLYGPDGTPLEEETANGSELFFHHDQSGSTRVLTDLTGDVVGTATYGAYGQTTAITGVTTPLGYDGQFTDSETHLVYLQARYYDPSTATFLSVDPDVTTTLTPYSYAGDNPLSNEDPAGDVWMQTKYAWLLDKFLRAVVWGNNLTPIISAMPLWLQAILPGLADKAQEILNDLPDAISQARQKNAAAAKNHRGTYVPQWGVNITLPAGAVSVTTRPRQKQLPGGGTKTLPPGQSSCTHQAVDGLESSGCSRNPNTGSGIPGTGDLL